MEGRLAAADASFDLSHDDDDDALVPSPAQYLASESANPADIVAEENASADELARLKQALKHLDPRAEAIVTRRWLNETKATLHELADEYGISAERVRQLEQAAMKADPLWVSSRHEWFAPARAGSGEWRHLGDARRLRSTCAKGQVASRRLVGFSNSCSVPDDAQSCTHCRRSLALASPRGHFHDMLRWPSVLASFFSLAVFMG